MVPHVHSIVHYGMVQDWVYMYIHVLPQYSMVYTSWVQCGMVPCYQCIIVWYLMGIHYHSMAWYGTSWVYTTTAWYGTSWVYTTTAWHSATHNTAHTVPATTWVESALEDLHPQNGKEVVDD